MSSRSSSAVCWDASVLLAMINNENGRAGHCNAVFQAAQSGEFTIYASAIRIRYIARPLRFFDCAAFHARRHSLLQNSRHSLRSAPHVRHTFGPSNSS